MNLRWTYAASLVFFLGVASCSRAPATFEPTPFPHSANDRTAVRARLAAHRDQQVERLETYSRAGAFPHDETVAPSLHVFKDAAGRLCAVANLVHADGRDDLVAATVREHNDLAIADVHGGAMGEWILASGLTQEELARIQVPAVYVPRVSEAQLQAAVRAHIAEVEAELRANREASLDSAVERYVARANGVAS